MSTSIDLRRLEHLVCLAEELHFTRAAERANLSQTAFSRSIQTLEQEFGLRVFDRGTRSVELTGAGRQLVTRARELLRLARDFSAEVENITQSDGGELAFGASLMAVDGVMQGVLPQLTAERPRLRLKVEVGQSQLLLEHLEQDRIEFFVAYPGALTEDRNYQITSLPAQTASIFCRAQHPLAKGEGPVRAKELAAFPWSSVAMPKGLGESLQHLILGPGQAVQPLSLSCDNQHLLRENLLSSDTLLFTWSSWLHQDLASGSVVDLEPRLKPRLPASILKLDCAIVQRAGRTLSPAAQALVSLLVRNAGRAGRR